LQQGTLTGSPTIDLVGPTGYVLGVDPLPLRIELAQTKARPNLEFKVADA
jgi:arsenite methyltransferase